MKISIITLHRVRNYGSSLQTLATQSFFEKLGFQVEVIDYYPERYTSAGLLKRLKNKSAKLQNNVILLMGAKMIMSISYLKKKIIFDQFLKKYINLSEHTYRTENDLKDYPLNSDAYCTGSDQVWNSHWNEGIDSPLYLSFVPHEMYKFSYASSIGNEMLSNEEAAMVSGLLRDYAHIAVRENKGVAVLERIGLRAVQMLDPTLLFSMEFWNRYVKDKYGKKRYIVTYNLHHDKRVDELAQNLAKEYGMKVYNISYNIHDIVRKGTLKWCPSVEDYLDLIRNAQYVVTDSFHATVFSLVFHTKFFSIYPEQASSRIRSILALTGLSNRASDQIPEISQVAADIDFQKTDRILENERQKAAAYMDMIKNEITERATKEKC
ncbi:MAG: polysaccharide pyruvyl transferase family protein [Oscillospiraceae bacterium]|nr:polysaccharide pyruvyl transferase family protein [Oscillospiraceae bacterium]